RIVPPHSREQGARGRPRAIPTLKRCVEARLALERSESRRLRALRLLDEDSSLPVLAHEEAAVSSFDGGDHDLTVDDAPGRHQALVEEIGNHAGECQQHGITSSPDPSVPATSSTRDWPKGRTPACSPRMAMERLLAAAVVARSPAASGPVSSWGDTM